MAPDFDPYYKWLAIPPEDQPPHHYRLLGVPLFTDDVEVLKHAADQRTLYLGTLGSGDHASAARQLLDEVAAASRCLLSADEKPAYDSDLRLELSAEAPAAPTELWTLEDEEPAELLGPSESRPIYLDDVDADAAPIRRGAGRAASSSVLAELAKIVAGGAAGLVLGYLFVCWIKPQADFLRLFANRPHAPRLVEERPAAKPPAPPLQSGSPLVRQATPLPMTPIDPSIPLLGPTPAIEWHPEPPLESMPPLLPPIESRRSIPFPADAGSQPMEQQANDVFTRQE